MKADSETLAVAATCLRFFAISLPGEIFAQILLYQYLSIGKPGLSSLICVLHNFVFLIVPAYILSAFMGLNGI